MVVSTITTGGSSSRKIRRPYGSRGFGAGQRVAHGGRRAGLYREPARRGPLPGTRVAPPLPTLSRGPLENRRLSWPGRRAVSAGEVLARWVTSIVSVGLGTVLTVSAAPVSTAPDRVHQVPAPRAWMAAAACADPDLDPGLRAVFTTDEPTSFDRAARAVCARCPVFSNCESHACGVAHIAGIWAGRRRGLPGRPGRSPAVDLARAGR